jgi:hypothetical protein
MRLTDRLRKLEDSLATKERALFWLETAKAEGGFIRYSERHYTQKADTAWISNQEAFFFYDLVCKLNIAVLDYKVARLPQLRWLHVALLQSLELCARTGQADEVHAIRSEFVEMMDDTRAFKAAAAEISDTFFDGHQVLFDDTMSDLESTISRFRRIEGNFNGAAKMLKINLIEMEEVSEACLARAQSYVKESVRTARSAALLWAGSPNAALRELCPTHCFHRLLGQPCPA